MNPEEPNHPSAANPVATPWFQGEHRLCGFAERDRYAASAMSALRFAISLLLLVFVSAGFASPADDLASISQSTRDAAAKVQRETWTPPARTNWDSLLASVKEGTPRTKILELLLPFKVTPEDGGASGTVMFQSYRLDDLWLLQCSYRDGGDYPLLRRGLVEQMRSVWLLPPTNFTGIWTTYWINGQRQMEVHCTNGRNHGEFIGFYSDGKRAYVQHFKYGRIDGEDIGYFRSGRTNYLGLYRDEKQVGVWVHFNEDGSTNSVRDYSKP